MARKWYDDGEDHDDRKRNKSRPKDEYRRKGREKRDGRFNELMERDEPEPIRSRYGDDDY